ncbi:hypothetical protein AMATHDRAFT_68561 [Amanita thiersii Skay4041]|uniref:Molybdate-anion transporter n=1 Tax=Amanita thiersii Skay4041 TaxID=703135 RepID=A0A2A9NGV5_9AGAR|nr:hypothetical protein AMATHDRAFT_68561 [Amanita thiersii Skay4041]
MSASYESQLVLLACICLSSLYLQRQSYFSSESGHESAKTKPGSMDNKTQDNITLTAGSLSRRYLIVYGFAMCADWLQGPYLYSLYHEQYNYSERLVAVLFVTGFLFAGISAPFVGVWADQYGRKRVCLSFCITYASACLCKWVHYYPFLLFGRVLGGVSTSILFSSFEAWLISSATSISLPESNLSTIMGRATLVNGLVATAAGVVSNELVKLTNTFRSPFGLAAIVLAMSWIVIKVLWSENYGNQDDIHHSHGQSTFSLQRMKEAWSMLYTDRQLLVLCLTQTCFEGSMYIFVFAWVPSLQQASASTSPLPLGYIFSSFMISMMLGSLLYTAITSRFLTSFTKPHTAPSTPALELIAPDSDSYPLFTPPVSPSLLLHAKLSSFVCLLSSLAFGASILSTSAQPRFWAFCVFEACVGMYYPVQGMLRGALIPDEHRATISSLFRIPLNIFVIISLLTGVSSARQIVLAACSAVLAFSSLTMFLNSLSYTNRTRYSELSRVDADGDAQT